MILRAKNIGLRLAYEQWGVGAPYSDGYSVTTLPIPFSNTDYTVIANSSWLNSGAVMASAALSVTQIKVRNGGYTDTYHFLTIGRQQWGVSTTSFPISVSAVYSIIAAKKDTSANSVPDVQNYSSTGFAYYGPSPYAWFAVCKAQQWGNAGSNNGSVDVTFPISFTKAVYQIQLTYNNSSYENPTYEIKDTKSFSYWSKYGGDKLWLAIGVQQWGYCNNGSQISFPMAYKTKCYAITFGVHYNGSQYDYNQVVSYNTLGFTMYQTVGTNGLAIMWIALGVQQWGVTTSNSGTITFPLAHKSSVFAVTLFMEAHGTSTIYIYAQSISLDNFVITSAIPQSQFQSFAKAYWISLGV